MNMYTIYNVYFNEHVNVLFRDIETVWEYIFFCIRWKWKNKDEPLNNALFQSHLLFLFVTYYFMK